MAIVTTQVFDPEAGRLMDIVAGTGNIVQNFSYAYDVLGNVLTRADANENLSENQTLASELRESGGRIVGARKPGVPGGTQIPPMAVDILRGPLIMSIDQIDKVDFITLDKASGDVWLTVSDHLPWDKDESTHLVLLQNKINKYLGFIESGEIFEKVPYTNGRRIVINIVGKYPLSLQAELFFERAQGAIEEFGFRLQFSLM